MIEHPPIKALEYNAIADAIFIGTNYCCQTHFDERLRQEGIEADISLEEERIDTPFGVRFYTWIPIKNHAAPTQEQLTFGVAVIEQLVRMGKKVYVHCQNGHGRAPTLVAAYFMKHGGLNVAATLDRIKRKRPTIHLEDVQVQALERWASAHRQRSAEL